MSRLFSLKSIGLSVLAAALCLSFSPNVMAQNSEAGVAGPRALITGPVDESQLKSLSRLAPLKSMYFQDRGPVDPSMEIEGQLLLKRSPESEQALDELKTRFSTPGDPLYGQTLTAQLYSETFGVAPSDMTVLNAWLKSHGLEVTGESAGKLVINFKGSAAQADSAFHTELHSYLGLDGKVYYAPGISVKIPKALSGVVNYPMGLNSAAMKSLPSYDGPVTKNGEKIPPSDFTLLASEPEPHPSIADLAGSQLTPIVAHGVRPDLSTPTMAVTVSPTSIAGGSITTPNITATLTYSGTPAPTGTITFMDGAFDINLTVSTTSAGCTTTSTTITCVQAFGSAPVDNFNPDLIYAAYSGDTNYNPAFNPYSAAAQLAETGATGSGTLSVFSLTVTSGTQTPGTGSSQSIVVTITGSSATPTGTIVVAGSAQLGQLFSSTLGSDGRCVLGTRKYTCTYPWSPAANTPDGEYYIMAAYSGSSTIEGPYITTYAFNFKVTNTTGTTTTTIAQSDQPGTEENSLTSSTITTQTTWTGAGAQATGGLQLTGTFDNEGATAVSPQIYATITYPTAPSTTSSGAGGFVDVDFATAVNAYGAPYIYSYTCTTNVTTLTVTCNITIPNLGAALTSSGSNTITAQYWGDATYKASAGTTTVVSSSGATASTDTLTASNTVYGGPISYTSVIATATAAPTGSYVLSGTPISATGYPLLTTINTTGSTPCVLSTDTKTCTNSLAIPAADDAVGNMYTVTSSYSGTASIAPASGSVTFTITQQTPTFGTMTVTPNSVIQGTSTAVVLSDTFSWTGTGSAPTGAITYTLNSVNYTASCSPATSPQTCTATVPGATVAALAGGPYVVGLSYAGDANYTSATAANGSLNIVTSTTSTMTSPTSASPVTQSFGSLSAFTVTGAIAYGSGTAPLASAVSFTSTAAGTFGAVSCNGAASSDVCSATFTPTATDAPGSYNINIVFAGDGNNAPSSSSQTGNYIITKATITTIQMTTSSYTTPPTATTQAYGATAAFTVYATLSPVGTVGVTAADVTFTVTGGTATGSFGATTCTVVSGADHCSATFTPSVTAAVGSYAINVSFTGDADYNAAGPSTNGAGLYVITAGTPAFSVAPSPIAAFYQSTTAITLTFTSSAPGTVNITGSYATYGMLSSTSCTIAATTCTVTFTPNGTTGPGMYSNILTATLTPTNINYNTVSVNDSLTIASGTGTKLVVIPATPVATDYGGSGTAALTATLSWTAEGVQPTGTITLTNTINSLVFGGVTLPTSATATSGTCSTSPATGSCSYTCTPNLTDQLVSCTLTDNQAASRSVLEPSTYQSVISASYVTSDGFMAATGTTDIYYNSSDTSGSAPTITTNTATLPAATYGLTQTETATVTVKSNGSTAEPFQTGSNTFLQATSTNQLGTLYTTTDSACGGTGNNCVISGGTTGNTPPLFTVPAVVTPGAYTVTYYYTGDYQFSSGFDAVGSVTASLTVNQQTPTLTMGSVAPASGNMGTVGNVALSIQLNWTGVGAIPTGAVTFAVVGPSPATTGISGSPFTAACANFTSTGSGNSEANSETCTATVPAATANALATGAYTATATYAGDVNYAAVMNAAVGTLTVNAALVTPTLTLSPQPVTDSYGVAAPGGDQAIIATLTGTSAAGSSAASTVTVNIASVCGSGTCGSLSATVGASSGSSSATCSTVTGGNAYTSSCRVYYIPNGTTPASTYTGVFTATSTATGNYNAVTTAATDDLSITAATETLSMVAGTPGSTSTGVTSTTLVATLSVPASGATVTFTDVTTSAIIGFAATNASGVATITVNTAGNGSGQASKPSGGKDLFSAAAGATANTAAASTTSNTTVYFQGILFSAFSPLHNFSGLLTGGNNPYSCCSSGVEGTVDGTSGAAYGIAVYNFTMTSQTLPVTFTNSTAGAFTYANECGATLTAGEACTLVFNYAPPAGDGCTPAEPQTGSSCTFDMAPLPGPYPQGTYESATWSYTLPGGVIAGLGNQAFTLSGTVASGSTLAGKALLEPLGLNVSPTTVNFGTVPQGSTTQTITVTVQNTNGSAVPFSVSGPNGASSSTFTVNNKCGSSLAANSACSIFVSMVTTSLGTFSGDTLTITPSGSSAITVNLSGTVVAASSGITLSSNNHNFGSVTDGTTATWGFNLTNNTASTQTLTFSNSAGAGYSTSTTCNGTNLAAGATCTYGFTFAPTTPGAAADTLTITSSVPVLPGNGSDTGTVTVNGTGVVGGNLTATSVTHNFGTIAIGTSGGNYGVEITNNTSSAVTLSYSGLTNTSAGFSLVGSTCGATLAVNANCELLFSFTPTSTGFVTGTYPITSSSPLYSGGSPVNPSQITLKGTGD